MSDRPSHNLGGLDIDMARRIAAVCRRFEADWRGGERPPLDDYLADVPAEGRPALRAELKVLERELRPSEPMIARPEAGSATALVSSPPPPSTAAAAPTIGPGIAPTSLPTGAATVVIGEDPTLPPHDEATVDHSPAESARPDGAAPARVRRFGDYELLREIARGGMGIVFHARQLSLNRPVALKMILAGHLANDVDVKRFYMEAEAAANLDHPGIVPIYEVGQYEGQHYFSMGFVEGQSLSQRLADGPLPPRQAAALMVKVAEAISYAHRRGLIHRDLKPANVLLDQNGNPRVTDFGLAKKLEVDSGLTGSGQIMGTPSYMPPEQATGQRGAVGPAADVYALGATLYAMVTGRPPFQAATPMDTVLQILSEEPVPPRRLNASISPDLETICLKCLEKETDRRYSGAAALGEDLRRYLAGAPILARPVGQAERAWRWCRRNPSLAGMTIALLLVMLVGYVGVTAQWIRAEKNAEKEAGARRAAEDAEEQTGRYLYVARMNLAQQAAETDQTRRLLEVLSPYHPGTRLEHLRGFEWYYWWRTCHLYQDGLDGNGGFVSTLAFRPNCMTLASGSEDGKIRQWDYPTGRLASTFNGHAGQVRCMAFSRDGTFLATGGVDSLIRIWRSATGEPKSLLNADAGPVRSVAFSPDGTTLASAHADGTIRLWDAASGRPQATLRGHKGRVFAVAFSPDGTVLASGGHDRTVRLWDPATYKPRTTLEGHSDWVRTIAFSPDGTLLASSGDDFTIVLWEVAAGRLRSTLRGHTNNVNTVAFSPDGTTLASSGEDATIRLWDPAIGRIKGTLRGHTDGVSSVAFPSDGMILASASADGTIKLWDHAAKRPETTLEGHESWVYSVAITSDSATLASASFDGTIMLWDLRAGKLKKTLATNADRARYVAFSPDGTTLASAHADGTIRLWDAASGRPQATLRGHASAVLAVAFSPDGTTLASTSFDKTVRLWDMATGEPKAMLLAPGSVVNPLPVVDHALVSASVAYSPDGATLASSNTDRGVTLWNLATGKTRATLDCQASMGRSVAFSSVAFSFDGKTLASVGPGLDVELWGTETGNRKAILKGHSAPIRFVAFCPDGRTLASAGDDRTIMLWDTVTGEPKTTLRGHKDYVSCLAFSPDGTTLVSGSRDKTVRLWRAASEEEVLIRRYSRARNKE